MSKKDKLRKANKDIEEAKEYETLLKQEYEQNGAKLSEAILKENGLALMEYCSTEAVEIVRDACNQILDTRAN